MLFTLSVSYNPSLVVCEPLERKIEKSSLFNVIGYGNKKNNS